ncbi:MAG: FMN-binding protein [Melioribacteraceae bacterium]|nr:FMN-binding protein [Melioribacteraceae bacterium]MCF8356848.1 FMN-binding protein [Melioribacteraceae bacterium]MCF8396227.1 FMN-binding protein [Melioribacteraceae bacterium]MCF8421150.1 FMN-binding protein [Melioribacteraceae bacterium]
MYLKIFVCLLFIGLLGEVFAGNEIREKSEKIIHSRFGESSTFELIKYQISDEIKSQIENKCGQRFFKNFVYLYKIKGSEGEKAFALLDNVYGKSMPITFMVIFNTDGKILTSEIIKYREPYGGGVASSEWNSQFIDKDAGSSFEVGKNIDSISGATISVRSVTKGINKLALLIDLIKEKI